MRVSGLPSPSWSRSRVIRLALDGAAPGHIAIDGKSLKGSRRLDDKAIHVLSAFSTDLGAVIGDLVVEPDKNEITAAITCSSSKTTSRL